MSNQYVDDDDLLLFLGAIILCDDEIDAIDSMKGDSVMRSRLDWEDHVFKLNHEGMFERKYRMSQKAFENLVSLIQPIIDYDENKNRYALVSVQVMLAITLRLLAGGSYLDVYENYGVCFKTLYGLRDKVISAILSCDCLKIRFPTTENGLHEIRLGFMEASSYNLFHKCVGCIDGMLQEITCPSREDCDGNQDGYFSGHYQTYGLNCQGMCDSWLRFTFFAVAAPGKVPDQVAIERTRFNRILESIPPYHYILADPAYLLTNKVLVPFTGSQRDNPENDSFNFHLSQLRIRIEMAFGRLVGKWRILRSPLQQGSLRKNIEIIMVCATLHNYVINMDIDLSIDINNLTNDFHDIQPLQRNNGVINHLGYVPTMEPFVDVRGTSEIRSVIVEYIKNNNIYRTVTTSIILSP